MKKMIPCHILKNLLIKGNCIMKKLLLSTALAVILTSPAIAEEKSITIVCSDDVEKGTVVLSDPPKMSCEDFDLASRYVGSGFSIGPDTTIEDVKAFLAKWVVRQEQKKKHHPQCICIKIVFIVEFFIMENILIRVEEYNSQILLNNLLIIT